LLSGESERKLSELFCAVLCATVVHSDTHTHIRAVLKDDCWFKIDCLILVLLTLVVLGLVSSVLSQEIGHGKNVSDMA